MTAVPLASDQVARLERVVAAEPTVEKGKLVLPPLPANDDLAGHAVWLTRVLARDPGHPITGAEWQGLRGPAGHVVLNRAAAPPIRFEPATHVNQPQRLSETLSWQRIPTDLPLFPYKADHCRQIAHSIGCLVDATSTATVEDEAAGIVSTFMLTGLSIEGHTIYGTSGQRYEAALSLRRPIDESWGRPVGPSRYLIDSSTGELVIAVSDLGEAARRHVGSSLPRGWLDARMQGLGWERIQLQGHEQQGRDGRRGPHARINAYRGHVPGEDEEGVNT